MFSNEMSNTPEGMFLLDRLQDDCRVETEQLEEQVGPAGIALQQEMERRFEHAMLCGTPCEHYPDARS
jgi:hypothetical protein